MSAMKAKRGPRTEQEWNELYKKIDHLLHEKLPVVVAAGERVTQCEQAYMAAVKGVVNGLLSQLGKEERRSLLEDLYEENSEKDRSQP